MIYHKSFNAVMLGALLSLGIVSSCKNYDDDINSLNNRVTAIESDIANVKKELEGAVNNKIFITDYYENENGNGWVLLLGDGKKIEIPASGNKEITFFQFKTDNGVWKVSTDKGGNWTPVKDGANNEITAQKTDNIKFDETSGKIYIGDKETTISCDKSSPILAENQLSQTVYIAIGGESYVIKMSGSDYEGISAIIFRKQHVFDKEDYLEASILTNGEKTLVSRPATAQFRILPEDIELTKEDNYQCKDIHQVEPSTRAGEELKIDFKEFKDGLLTLELTPASMEHDLYYGSTLEITVNDATTSSDYFVVHPAIRDLKDAAIFSTDDRYPVAEEKVIEFSSKDGIDLSQAFAVGFNTGENGEYKSMDELFTENEMQGIMNAAEYKMTEGTGYTVSTEGKLTADNNTQSACKVTISYTIDGKTISATQQFLAVIPAEKMVFTGELGNIRPLSQSTREIPLNQTEGTTATLEALSETVELGTKDQNSNYTKLEGVSLSVKDNNLYLVVAAKTDIELTDATLYAIKDGKIANINGGNWEISNVTLHKYEESVTPKKESQYMKDGVIIGRKSSNSKNEGKNDYTFENISVHELYDIIPEDLEVKFEYNADRYLDGKLNNENHTLKDNNTAIDTSKPGNINKKLKWGEDTQTFSVLKRITAKKWQVTIKATTTEGMLLNETTWNFQSPIDVDNMDNFLPHKTPITYNGKVEQGGTISFADLVKDTWKTRLSIKNLVDGQEWLVYESGLGVYQTDWAKANLLEDGGSQGLYFRIGQINNESYNDQFPDKKKVFRAREDEKWMKHDYDSKTGIFTCTEYYDPTKEYTLKCGVGYHSDFGTTFFSNNKITIIIPAQE